MTKHTNVRLSDETAELVEAIQRASGETDAVPFLNQSSVIRLLLRSGARQITDGDGIETDVDEIDDDVLTELVPDHTIARYLREDLKDETWLVDMREGFEGRVRNQLAERFKGGYDPDGIAAFAETFTREAHIYWQLIEDDPETYQEKVSFVQEKVEQYREKWETSTFDPDEEWLSSFGGVEDGEQQQTVDSVPDEIMTEISDRLARGRSADAVADAISNNYDVEPDVAERIVRTAKRERNGNGSQPAIEDPDEDVVDVDAPAIGDGGVVDE